MKKDNPLVISKKREVRNKLTNELLTNIPIEIIGCEGNGKYLTTLKQFTLIIMDTTK